MGENDDQRFGKYVGFLISSCENLCIFFFKSLREPGKNRLMLQTNVR